MSATRRPWLALAALAAEFMVFLDETVVNVALPSIKTELEFSQTTLACVASVYIVVFGALVLLGGRLADIRRRRRMFLVGTAIFGAASLDDGRAQSQDAVAADVDRGLAVEPGDQRPARELGRVESASPPSEMPFDVRPPSVDSIIPKGGGERALRRWVTGGESETCVRLSSSGVCGASDCRADGCPRPRCRVARGERS